MDWRTTLTRRTFLADLGRGTLAISVVGIAACAPSPGSAASGGSPRASASLASASPRPSTSIAPSPPPSAAPDGAIAWERVNLGFVSAYILVRGGEAAVVDTGVGGSETAIGSSLAAVGLAWDAVAHVIFTHKHGDHAGSAEAVLELATGATGYAGAEDLPAIGAPRPMTAVADGDQVFGLRIVATPGHTAGHVAVLDEVGGILVAGDALNTSSGALTGSSPQNTADPVAAQATLVKLGALTFETLLVGHGEPILTGASAEVAALAAAG